MILASLKSIYQPISGKNTETRVVALGAMTFEDAMNMVSQDAMVLAA
jgi:multisubunit Na+/H+ antiporter MnhF subunit